MMKHEPEEVNTVSPREPSSWFITTPVDSYYGLAGWAFYEDLPLEAVWMANQETWQLWEVEPDMIQEFMHDFREFGPAQIN